MTRKENLRKMNGLIACGVLGIMILALAPAQVADACSRLVYETGYGSYITARGMDWNDPSAESALWVFPRGIAREGGGGDNPVKWTSKYGSVVVSFYGGASSDGMNEKGLVANVLYLAEADYGDPAKTGKPTLSVLAWVQYFLDNYASVDEAVGAMDADPFTVVSPILPNGRPASLHLSLSDGTGDSAVLEYIGGELQIHHSPDYAIVTNSPVFDQQLALVAYWEEIGGNRFLPGTINAADRFVRLSYLVKASPQYKDPYMARAAAFSQIRAVGVPLGMADPDHPNISATLWRTVADHGESVYYFESATLPAVMWVDLKKADFSKGADARMIVIDVKAPIAGDVTAKLKPAKPYTF